MKIFVCDKCGKKFPQAIEEVKFKDKHGNWHVLDLCAPDKNTLEAKKTDLEREFVK